MIGTKEIAIIRAALQYFSEEVGDYGQTAIEPYLAEPDKSIETSSDEIKGLIAFFHDVEIIQVRYDRGSQTLSSSNSDRVVAASLLIPGQSFRSPS